MYFPFSCSPCRFHACSPSSPVGAGGPINPISTREGGLAPLITIFPSILLIFRLSYGPVPNILTEAGAESAGPFLHVAVFVVHDDDYLVFGSKSFDALTFDARTF